MNNPAVLVTKAAEFKFWEIPDLTAARKDYTLTESIIGRTRIGPSLLGRSTIPTANYYFGQSSTS